MNGFIAGGSTRVVEVAFQAVTGTDLTWAAQPAAVTLLMGNARHIKLFDLDGFSQARLCCWKAAMAGASGAKLYLRYYTSHTTTAANYIQIGASADVSLSIDVSSTFLDSGWSNLASGAKIASAALAVIGQNGDGATSPTFGEIYAMFR